MTKSPMPNHFWHKLSAAVMCGKSKDMKSFHCGCAHLVTQGFLSGSPGSSVSSSASRPPRWPAGPGSCQSDLNTEESYSTVFRLTMLSYFIV